jgi:hypothetical protein
MPTKDREHISMCLYGIPGIGKTRFVGGTPGKVLLIRPPVDHTESILIPDRAGITERVVRDWDDMQKLEDELRHDGRRWDWVWVDSVSLLQDYLLDDVLETEIANSNNPKRADYGPDQGVYGRNMFRIAAWMRHAAIGPDLFNFGWTAHVEELPSPDVDEDDDPVTKLMPWVQGKQMASKLCGYVNLVAYYGWARIKGADGPKRVLRTQSSEKFYAKDQYDALTAKSGRMVEPSMPRLIEAIEQSPRRNVREGTPRRGTTTNTTKNARRPVRVRKG